MGRDSRDYAPDVMQSVCTAHKKAISGLEAADAKTVAEYVKSLK